MEMKNVADFIDACHSEDVDNLNLLFFRGENAKHDKLIPSIYRPQFKYIENEDIIFKETLAKFPDEMLAQKTTVEKLILMQHYELPTRLLDISKNPLVALFFACYGNEDQDGRVYMFSVPEAEIKYCDSDTVSVIANICRRSCSFSIEGTAPMSLKKFNKTDEISYLVHEIREEKPYFQNLVVRKDVNSVVCIRPRMNNPRILRQDGYFLLFGVNNRKDRCAVVKKSWVRNSVLIPKESKKTILKELDFLNINESFLFPDYQHLASTFRDKYQIHA
ncbi:MAG: FRG domain-containing protein [Pelobacteraceae bacterium]